MNGQQLIDFNKLSRTIDTLSSMEGTIHSELLDDAFLSMRDYLDYVNCNHTDCLTYKDTINSIFLALDTLKNRLDDLTVSLTQLKSSFSSTESLTTSLDSLKKETSVDPIPIGVTIGATAAVGGIGAAIMDRRYEKKETSSDISEIELDSYESKDDYDEEVQHPQKEELEEYTYYEDFDE